MKCPLLQRYLIQEHPLEKDIIDDCLKDECAWWYEDNQCCAVLTIAQGAVYQHLAILALREVQESK